MAADALDLSGGDRARVTTRRGTAVATVEVTDVMLSGHISLPNGFGLGPSSDAVGIAPNELTSTDDRDWFAGTPHHTHIAARLAQGPDDRAVIRPMVVDERTGERLNLRTTTMGRPPRSSSPTNPSPPPASAD